MADSKENKGDLGSERVKRTVLYHQLAMLCFEYLSPLESVRDIPDKNTCHTLSDVNFLLFFKVIFRVSLN